ncbi:glycosyltransferase family 1 protein, partial [Micromonospora sp. NPDC047753]
MAGTAVPPGRPGSPGTSPPVRRRALLDDPAARAELGRRGAERAATWPTEADTVATLAALYAELAGNPGGPAAAPGSDAPRTGHR